MSDHSFRNVREPLLREGISPRHVNRYVTELREHLADLIARERAAGMGEAEAEAKARILLGSDAELVKAMIARRPPRSLASQAPWAVFGLFPFAALIAFVLLLHVLAMGLLSPYRALPGTDIPGGIHAAGVALSFFGSYVVAAALAAICIVIALRQRLASRWIWVGLAIIAIVSGPLGVHIQFLGPEAGMSGGIRGSLVPAVFVDGRLDATATLVKIALRTAVLFALSAIVFRALRQRIIDARQPASPVR